jgi:LPXTG-motif cell wall-anchored protein
LTEVKAPEGYTTRKDTVYFMITKDSVSGDYVVTYYADAKGEKQTTKEWIADTSSGTDVTLTVKDEAVTRNVTVTKMWDDGDGAERPESLVVTLVAKVNGEEVTALNEASTFTKELTSDNNWKHTWTNLPAYYNGEKVDYVAEEGSVDSMYAYEQVETETVETAAAEAVDYIEESGTSGAVARVAASYARYGGNNSSGSSTSVDHIDIATNLTATVVIDGTSTTADFTFTPEDVENLTIIGKNSTGTVYNNNSVTSTSTSTDSSGNSQIRISGTFPVGTLSDPVYYTVTLNKTITVNGTEVPVTLTVTTNYWDSGNDCPGIGNNKTNWKNGSVVNGSGIDLSFGTGAGSAGNTGVITVQKTVEGVTLTADKTFTFNILKAGSLYTTVDVTVKAGNTTAVNMITGVPEGTYTVEEETDGIAIDGYTCSTVISEKQIIDSSNTNAYFNVVNAYSDNSFTVEVNKKWVGDSNDNKPDSVKATVYYSDGTKDSITLSKDNGWKYSSKGTKTIVDIRENMTQSFGEKTLGDYYTSSVSIATDGKSATLTNTLKETKDPDTEETVEPDNGEKETEETEEPDVVATDAYIYLTNKLQYEDVTLTKIWDDSVDTSHRPTSIPVTLSIIKDANNTVVKECGSYYITNSDSSKDDGKTVWTKKINLPKLADGYSYELTENWSSTYYTSSVDGLTITNTLSARDVKVVKIWDDANNKFETRPDSITVTLYNGDEAIRSAELSAGNDWKYTFEDVPLNGTYSVKEDDVLGYTATYDEDSAILAITNELNINWVLKKVSARNPNLTLEGAEFKLTGTGENKGKERNLTTVSDGTITIDDFIVNGTATLEETKAPAGYSISNTTWEITFEDGVIIDIVDTGSNTSTNAEITYTKDDGAVSAVVTIKDDVVYSLPQAGGSGIFWYIISGMLLMMAGALIIYKRKCREVLGR